MASCHGRARLDAVGASGNGAVGQVSVDPHIGLAGAQSAGCVDCRFRQLTNVDALRGINQSVTHQAWEFSHPGG